MSSPPITPPSGAQGSSISSANYESVIILNRIFALVLGMISSLQFAGAAQANRLTFLSEWQKGYTDTMAQLPTFISGDPTTFFGNRPEERADANRFNASFLQTMQNRQSLISDDAKALQSNVNQTNDAVNQQSNLGTAILQQLSTLLATIFK